MATLRVKLIYLIYVDKDHISSKSNWRQRFKVEHFTEVKEEVTQEWISLKGKEPAEKVSLSCYQRLLIVRFNLMNV